MIVNVRSMDGDDEAPLQCNTEKDKGRFRHRTAGKHGNMIIVTGLCGESTASINFLPVE